MLGISLACFIIVSNAHGQESKGWKFRQKAALKEASRWSLQEWMAQKSKMSLMDQWLLMHSPSPYEFFLQGASTHYETQRDSQSWRGSSFEGEGGAFAGAFGLTAHYENNAWDQYTDLSGYLKVRVLGNSLQTTSITLGIGQRTRDSFSQIDAQRVVVRNMAGSGELQIYLTRHFGLRGSYQKFLAHKASSGLNSEGTKQEYHLFLDFGPLQVFGGQTQEENNESKAGATSTQKSKALKTGLRMNF